MSEADISLDFLQACAGPSEVFRATSLLVGDGLNGSSSFELIPSNPGFKSDVTFSVNCLAAFERCGGDASPTIDESTACFGKVAVVLGDVAIVLGKVEEVVSPSLTRVSWFDEQEFAFCADCVVGSGFRFVAAEDVNSTGVSMGLWGLVLLVCSG